MTAVNADNGGPGPGGFVGPGMASDNLTTRVASILGIDRSRLVDAFRQAEKSLETDRMNAVFTKLVADGKLTQAQADQYKTWLAARPENVPGFFSSDNVTRDNEMLSRLLKDGRLTQAQYDAATAWLAQKPNITLPKPQRPSNGGADTSKPRGMPGLGTGMLDQLLKDGKITQATYDAYKTWLSQKPAIELPVPQVPPNGPPPTR